MLLARDVVHAQVVASVVLDPVQMAVEVVVNHVLHNVVLTDALVAVDRVPDHALDTAGVNAPLIALAIVVVVVAHAVVKRVAVDVQHVQMRVPVVVQVVAQVHALEVATVAVLVRAGDAPVVPDVPIHAVMHV